MRIARHWVRETVEARDSRGAVHRGEAWGWSETDAEEARRRASASAARVAEWLARGSVWLRRDATEAPPPSAQYLYQLDRPPREEIVQELAGPGGETTALITRSIYGALVLSARELMFIDVDFPPPPQPGVGSLLSRLFGGAAPPPADPAEGVMDRVRAWCVENADRGVRLYRTAAGLRVALVAEPIEPCSPEARQILEELNSDPLYRRLCEAQQCFRARLSPKPWRIGCGRPPAQFPFTDTVKEQAYRRWQREYDDAAPQFATCQLVEAYGPTDVHPELSALVELHDSLTGVARDLPLA